MKTYKIITNHDRLRLGPFPQKELEEFDITVIVHKEGYAKEKVIIEFETTDDPIEVAYELGMLVQSIIDNRLIK